MKLWYLLLLCVFPVDAFVLRRIINLSKYSPVHITSIRKNYVEFFHEIKPESSLMLNAPIPVNAKVPRVFDGECAYTVALEKCNWLISFSFVSNVFFLCEAVLPHPKTKVQTRGIWIATYKGYDILYEIHSDDDKSPCQIAVNDFGEFDFSLFRYN